MYGMMKDEDLFCTTSLFIKKNPMCCPLSLERSCINSLGRTKDSCIYIQCKITSRKSSLLCVVMMQ